jgi:DNA gyrase/topoisomerase IV subunit B
MTYNVNSIKTMEFSEAVIKKIGMYLSGDLEEAVELGFRELIYNSVDEYLQDFGNKIDIVIDTKNQIFSCEDNARGIPVGMRADGTNSLVAALTLPHTGGKHDNEVYSGAVGINGMGASIVTHTSEWLIAIVKTNGIIYRVKFKGTDKGALIEEPLEEIGKTKETGTYIQYKPSENVYQNKKLDTNILLSTIEELSYFTKGLTFNVTIDGTKQTFHSKNGLADALSKKERVHKTALYFNKTINEVGVELALQWCRNGSQVKPFANNLYLPDGGLFVTGFKTSLTKAFNNVTSKSFEGDIIRKYLDGFVSVKVKVPQFSNQAKTSLANPEARTAVSSAITEAFKDFANNHPTDLEKIIDLMDMEQRAENAANRAREAEKSIVQGQKKAKMITNLPPKLADANGIGYKELFIVEGK